MILVFVSDIFHFFQKFCDEFPLQDKCKTLILSPSKQWIWRNQIRSPLIVPIKSEAEIIHFLNFRRKRVSTSNTKQGQSILLEFKNSLIFQRHCQFQHRQFFIFLLPDLEIAIFLFYAKKTSFVSPFVTLRV
jgi:hypothetical protein